MPSDLSGQAAARRAVTCVVADRDRGALEELCRALESAAVSVLGRTADGAEALDLIARLRPTLAILDTRLPGLDGFEIARRIGRDAGRTAIVLRAASTEDAMVIEAAERGVAGYLLREAPLDDQLRAILAVARGETYFDGVLLGAFARSQGLEKAEVLTRRERDILRLLADGLRTAEIGQRLYLSPDTVKVHLTKAKRKLEARTTAQAVAVALRRSLIS